MFPLRNKPYPLYVGTAVLLLVLLTTLSRHQKVPFPRVPDVPAHIPFTKSPTWNPDTNVTAYSTSGMVASDSEYCSQMGVDILKLGGNAADAAVTTCLCIGATDTMFSSGIGGGAFITAKNSTGAISIDAREMAPAGAYSDMFKGREHKSMYGGLASGIPGELIGLWTLYESHGSKNVTWQQLLEPVAEFVERGWRIDKRLAYALQIQKSAFAYFRKDWDFVFKSGTNKLLEEGDLMKRKALAKTLRYVGKKGGFAFYDAEDYIARSLAAKNQEWEGVITPDDFGKYKVVIQDASKLENFTAKNLTVYTANGASSGPALIYGLSILNEFENRDFHDYDVEETHKLIEVMKWMASARSYLGDIGVYNTNKTQMRDHEKRYAKFRDPNHIKEVKGRITQKTHPWQEYDPAYEPNDPNGTSSLSVVDSQGNAVSITTTINLLFGSCVHDPVTGVIFNDEMDDFSLPHTKNAFDLEPSVFNYIEPYKRPLSSSAQSIITDSEGNVELVIGAAGGSRITNAVFQGIIRTFLQEKNITDTIANPRFHHQLIPDVVTMESPQSDDFISSLENKGHNVRLDIPRSAMNGIRVRNGEMWGQGDWWRKFGVAVGV